MEYSLTLSDLKVCSVTGWYFHYGNNDGEKRLRIKRAELKTQINSKDKTRLGLFVVVHKT